MIIERMVRALDSRLKFAPLARRGLGKVFPDQWSFMLGEIALYAFIVLVLTGTFLTLFFEPSTVDTVYHGRYAPMDGQHTSAAFASTVNLSWDVRAGLLMRQTHHWTALIFIGAIILHLMRIFFTGAFRKPREINWLVGVTMLALAMLNGFSGYSMPDDLLSGTGLRIAYSVVESVPIVGSWLAFLVFGGEFPAQYTIPRLYISHVLLVPALLAVLITVHMVILIKQKHSQFPGPGRTEHNVVGSRFWPSYTVRTLGLAGWVFAVVFALGGLVQINPIWIYGPYEPASATSPAQPDWFVGWEEGALRLFPPADFRIFGYLVPTLFFPGVVLGALTFLGLYAYPFIEARFVPGDRVAHQLLDPPREHPARLGFGVGVFTFYFLLLAAAGDDIVADFLRVPVTTLINVLRILVITVPWVVGVIGFVLARALRLSGAPGLGGIRSRDLRAAFQRHPAVEKPAEKPARVPIDVALDAGPRVETWPTPGRTWRWRYVERSDSAEPVVLTSNVAALSEEEAEQAARTAYPETQVIPARDVEFDRAVRTRPDEVRAKPVHHVFAAIWLPIAALLRRRGNGRYRA